MMITYLVEMRRFALLLNVFSVMYVGGQTSRHMATGAACCSFHKAWCGR
jgi:hypothetical protein